MFLDINIFLIYKIISNLINIIIIYYLSLNYLNWFIYKYQLNSFNLKTYFENSQLVRKLIVSILM